MNFIEREPTHEGKEIAFPEVLVQEEPYLKKAIEYVEKNNNSEIIDGEAFEMGSLVYNHPEAREDILKQLEEYKPHVGNAGEYLDTVLDKIGKLPIREDGKKIDFEIRKNEAKERIEEMIKYFNPREDLYKVSKVIVVPSDDIVKKGGGSFKRGDEWIIVSHSQNKDNFDHEFLHGVINPAVKNAIEGIDEKTLKKITERAGGKIVADYGGYPFSILCEEFIRVYNEYIKYEKNPETNKKEFISKLENIPEEKFQEEIRRNKNLKRRMESLDIHTIEELKAKSNEYYELYERDGLGESIYKLYKDYETEKMSNLDASFGSFIKNKIETL